MKSKWKIASCVLVLGTGLALSVAAYSQSTSSVFPPPKPAFSGTVAPPAPGEARKIREKAIRSHHHAKKELKNNVKPNNKKGERS